MKLQIDTDNGNKIIRIEGSINLNELFEHLKQMFPNDLWKEFTLENITIVNWHDPIIIPWPGQPPQPINIPNIPYPNPGTAPYPSWPSPGWNTSYVGDPPYPLPWITCETNNVICELKPGTYNVQI